MTAEKRRRYERAVAEEMDAKDENIAAARGVAERLKAERQEVAELVARLRKAREKAGVSLNEMEARTGISKSSLSRLENSSGPNPTMLTLLRYAAAIGVTMQHRLVDSSSAEDAESPDSTSRPAAPASRNAG